MDEEKFIKVLFRHDEFDEQCCEGAWPKMVHKHNYQLDNILFYAKEFSRGDILSVEVINDKYYARDLIQESGNSTVRILFSSLDIIDSVRSEFSNMGCSSELSNINRLISVDIPKELNYDKVQDYLNSGKHESQ